MTILPSPQDYTDKDFEAINQRLELLIKALFTGWTDFERASFGNLLKECFAFSMDVLTYYQDQQARETRWGTVVLRENLIELARLIGYTLDGASAATAPVIFSMPSIRTTDVPIPIGTVVKTTGTNPVKFQTLAAAQITAGDLDSAAVDVEHSETQQDLFTAKGESGEEFLLTKRPYLDNSDSLVVGGNLWTRVDNFLDSTSTDKHYIVLVDAEDYAKFRVGDGTNGLIPTFGEAVIANYKTGGGDEGNVEAGSIRKVEGSFSDGEGTPVTLTCYNGVEANDGEPRETVAQARVNAPKSLRVLNRAIARTDYEDLAVQVSGVARALMLTRDDWTGVSEEGRGWMYIVPEGGGQPTLTLRTTVKTWIDTNYPGPLNFDWEIKDTTPYNTINIKAYVYLTANGTEAAVQDAVLAALREYFSPSDDDGAPNEAIDFGFNYRDNDNNPDPKVALSYIANLINDTAGVRRLGTPLDGEGITLNASQDDVDLAVNEFPEGGTLELWNGDTSTKFSGHPVAI